MDDEELIDRFNACENERMGELFRRYFARLVGLFHKGGLSAEESRIAALSAL